jgi:hypothetical protein
MSSKEVAESISKNLAVLSKEKGFKVITFNQVKNKILPTNEVVIQSEKYDNKERNLEKRIISYMCGQYKTGVSVAFKVTNDGSLLSVSLYIQ